MSDTAILLTILVTVIVLFVTEKIPVVLMPMVFASHAGSILALTGTPVNVLVSEAAQDAGTGDFRFFEFSLVGVPLLAGLIVILVVLGKHLLPNRTGESMPTDLSKHARTLVEQYHLVDGVFQMRVRASSPFIGVMPEAIEFDAYPGLSLIGLKSGSTNRPLARDAVSEGDMLLVRGDADTASVLATDKHLAPMQGDTHGDSSGILFNRTSGLAEVMIPPRSAMIGQKVFPGMVT